MTTHFAQSPTQISLWMGETSQAQTLVVIDAGVESVLLASAVEGVAEGQTAVLQLDPDQDGVEQLIAAIHQYDAATAVHILAHSTPGSLHLGNSQLDFTTLERYAWDLMVSCAERTLSLSLYGCSLAAGDTGAEFIEKLHRFTGANIAASTHPVGSAALGGSWKLNYQLGQVEAKLPIAQEVLASYPGLLAAPVITDLADTTKVTRATGEGLAQAISGISIEDADGGILTVTLQVAHGQINLAVTAGLTVTADGSGNVTLAGLASDINAALNGMTYSPTDTMLSVSGQIDDYSGTETLKITVTDDTSLTATKDVAIDITPINDAPTLALSAATALEGGSVSFTASNFGIVDVDNVDAQVMIKITELPGKGDLLLNGARLVVGSLFSVEDIAKLKYQHKGNQTTDPDGLADAFKFTVDDGAGGTIAATAMPINITPVNQLPTVGGSNSLFEGQLDAPVSMTISDPDQLAANYSVQILSLPADGILKLNGTAVMLNQTLSSADLSKLTYSHDGNDANFGNPPDVMFNVKVTDDGGGTGTPGSTTSTIILKIKPNNDDPLLTQNTGLVYNTNDDPDGVGVGQDQYTRLITANELKVSDLDSGTAQLTYTLTQAVDSTLGKLQLFSGGAWSRLTPGASFSQNDIDSGRLRYTFIKGQAGTFNDSFKFKVRDSEITEYLPGQPGVQRDGGIWKADGSELQELTFSITVTTPGGPGDSGGPTISANAFPTEVIVGQVLTTEAGSATITKAMLEYGDVDNAPDQLVYRITQTPTSGVIKLNGVTVPRFGSFTQQDINDGKVTFEHAGDEDFIDGFKFTVSDGTNVTLEEEFKLDITPLNDAPVISVKGKPYLVEGGMTDLSNVVFTVTDVDGSGEKSGQGFARINILTFKVIDLPVNGKLEVFRSGSWQLIDINTLLTKAELDGSKLRYVHDGGETIADSFKVQAYDDSGAANNTSNLATVDIEIAQLNDLPYYNSSKSLVVDEGGTGSIKGTDGKAGNEAHIEYLDPDNSTLQRQFRITKGVANGQLLRGGQALAVSSIFTQKDLDEGKITYKHNGSETTADKFEFQVSDGSGSSVPGSYDIEIKPSNDAPVLTTPGTQFLIDSDTLTFNAANNNRIIVTDPDLVLLQSGETDVMRVTLEVLKGGNLYNDVVLTLASTNGLNVTPVSNGKITLEGKLTDVQAALDGLKLQTTIDEDDALTLKVTANDLNNGGPDPIGAAPGYNIVTKTITINASSVNDPAVITAPATATANEDGTLLFNGSSGIGQTDKIVISDVDDFGRPITVEVSVGAGSGSLTATGAAGSGSNKLTFTGTKDQINTALASLGFAPTANFNGNLNLTVKVLDEGGGTAGGSQDVVITVNPLNDTPILTIPTAVQVIDNDNATPLTFAAGAISVNDNIDIAQGSSDQLTVTVTAKKASDGSIYGTLNSSGGGVVIGGNGTGTLTITGSQADINSALNNLSYTPANYNVDAVINLAVTVDDGNNGAEGTGSVGASTTVTRTIVVNISGVNDAPVLTAPTASISVNEDSFVTFTNAGKLFLVNDPDDFGASNLVATVKVDKGVLSLANNDGTTVTGADSDLMTIRGTEAQINAALDGLRFKPTPNYHGQAKLDVTINDGGNTGTGGAKEDTKSIFITVNPVNDRPVATGTAALGAVTEDNTNPSGTVISSLITNANYSDNTDNQTANGGGNTKTDLSYIAIVGSTSYTTAQGVWQFKDASGNWIDVPDSGLLVGSALVVRADREIRFVPAADFHGTPGTLKVRLADSSVAITESTSATDKKSLVTGPTSAWSNNDVTISASVTAQNDAPTILNATTAATLVGVGEDTLLPAGDTVSNLFSVKYEDITDDKRSIAGGGNSSTAFGGIAITNNAATASEGEWQYSINGGTNWTSVPTSGLSDTAAILLPTDAKLRFIPASDYNGTPGQLTVRFSDSPVTFSSAANLGSVGGTSNWSGSTTTLATSITPVNDAPILDGSAGSASDYTEQLAAVNIGGNLLDISDVEITRNEKSDLLTATVKIADFWTGDQLSFTVGSTGVTVTDNGNGSYTLAGTGATRANLLQVMQSAMFSSASDNPTNYDTDNTRKIDFQVNDNNGANNLSNVISTSISVIGVNDAPDAIDDSNTIAEEAASVTGNVRSNDIDPDNYLTSLTVSAVNGNAGDVGQTLMGKYGTLKINSDGSYIYSLDNSKLEVQQLGVGKSLTDEVFDYTISDGSLTDSAKLTITITGTNDAPVAVADTNSIFEDATAPAAGNVLPNDSDIDLGDVLTVSAVKGVAGNVGQTIAGKYGSLVLNANGIYSYSINNTNSTVQALGVGQSLTDEVFTYTVSDGKGGTASTTLTITINGMNDAPVAVADAKSTIVGQPPATGNLLINDSDVDTGDTLSVTQLNFGGSDKLLGTAFNSQYGSLTVNADGSYSYTADPNNPAVIALGVSKTLTETFTYTVSDNHGSTSTATLTITVGGINDAPVAHLDINSISEDAVNPVTGNALTNDTDVDGDTLNVTAVNGAAANLGKAVTGLYGSLTVNASGDYSYLLNNANGTVQALGIGESITDSFSYLISDGNGGTSTANIVMTIEGTNDAPVAVADVNSISEDALNPAMGNVLPNDTDKDTNDALSVSAVNGDPAKLGSAVNGSYGNLTLNANGTYSYVLDSSKPDVQELSVGDKLTEIFNYSVSDGNGGTASTTLTITINGTNDAPTAVADVNSIAEDVATPATGNVIAGGVGKDIDSDKSDILTVTQVNGNAANVGNALAGNYGNLTLNADGSYSYSLNNANLEVQTLGVGQTLTETYSYQISDGYGGFDQTTLKITINGTNDDPVAVADNGSTAVGKPAATGNLLDNDSDIDTGDTLNVTKISFDGSDKTLGTAFNSQYGSLTVNADGTYEYVVDPSNPAVLGLSETTTLTETFTYTISDGKGGTDTATLTITVGGINDAPIANLDTNSIFEDAVNPVTGNALTNDTDIDGDTLSVTAVNGQTSNLGQAVSGLYGSLTVNSNGEYSYSVNNASGTVQALSVGEFITDSFSYLISDGNGGTSTANIVITINGTNDEPVAAADINSVTEDIATPATGNVLNNDSDIDGDKLTVVEVNGDAGKVGTAFGGSYGSLTLNADGSYNYSLDNSNANVQALGSNETLSETFTYQISDGQGGLSNSTITITINGTNDGVEAVVDTNTINEDDLNPATGNVLSNDVDIDGDPMNVTQVNGDANHVGQPLNGIYGGLTLNANGSYSYSLDNSNPVVQALAINETLTDRFTYQISDGDSTSTTTLTITINGTNDKPIALADQDFIDENAVSPAQGNVLFNDKDPDQSDQLIVSQVSGSSADVGNLIQGQYGSLLLKADGSYSYTVDRSNPDVSTLPPGTQIAETFTYQITDGHGGFDESSLTITIGQNDSPLSADKTVTAIEDLPYFFSLNDFAFNDPDYGDGLSRVRIDSLPTNGELMLAGQTILPGQLIDLVDIFDGRLSFLAAPNANGNAYAQFSFSVQDSSGAANSFSKSPNKITVNITPVNDPPTLDLDGDDGSGVNGTGYRTLVAPGSPVAIADLDTQVTDIDNSNLQSATITLVNRPNGSSEFLMVLGKLPVGITASAYDSTTGQLKLSGSATLANYQAAIAAIGYSNSASARDNSPREVTVVVNDGVLDSNLAKTQIFYDTDGDGVSDIDDLDSDNDGILDLVEMGGDPNRDTDGDGIIDSLDLDSDNDGILDLEEAGFSPELLKSLDADGDGVIDLTNGFGKNGFANMLETFPDSAIPNQQPVDTDRDGAYDFQDVDSDNDGVSDLKESGRGFPDLNNDGRVDGSDSDGDGIRDSADGSAKFGRSPKGSPADGNNNGVPDYREVNRKRTSGSGADVVYGTDGDDILSGFSDLDILDGRGGNDIIMGGSDKDRLYGGDGNDVIMGGSNDDYIEGNNGDDILNGGSGNDLIYGGSGNDRINAGQGDDIVFGEAGNDRITGNEGNDKLYGGDGNDILIGGRGNDVLVGGRGRDKMTGGQGRDKFVYNSKQEFGDKITDFEIVKDRFDLSDLLKGGSMSAVQVKQRGKNTLVQVNAGNGFQNLATLQNVDADTIGKRHFIF